MKKVKSSKIVSISVSVFFAAFLLFGFFYLDNEKLHYLDSDVEEFTKTYYLGIAVLLSLIVTVITAIVQLKKGNRIKDFFKLLINVLVFCGLFFLLFEPLLVSSALFINRQSAKEDVVKNYEVLYVSDKQNVVAYNIDDENDLLFGKEYKRVNKNINLNKIKAGDSIEVKFKRGLLGINFISD